MYDELYDTWRLEIENDKLISLSPDFYVRLAEYMNNIKKENMLLETKKGIKANLLAKEMANARRMTGELVSTRYRKAAKLVVAGQEMPLKNLAPEEQVLFRALGSSGNAFVRFKEGLLEGQLEKTCPESPVQSVAEASRIIHHRIVLRFLKPVPSIIGADMKSYGPFLVEDVASLPSENARILVKQGLAKAVEIK